MKKRCISRYYLNCALIRKHGQLGILKRMFCALHTCKTKNDNVALRFKQ